MERNMKPRVLYLNPFTFFVLFFFLKFWSLHGINIDMAK